MPLTGEIALLTETRRDLHKHPEVAFQERRTAAIVAERLEAAGYTLTTGVAETGVVADLNGSGPGPRLLLRADMDALPIQEQNSHDYISTHPGVMHACGHDAHVAIGLAVAERLARTRDMWKGSVRYIFQPAEEGGGGALRMIEEGILEDVDAALGLHVWLGLPTGTIGAVDGPQMASSGDFTLEIRGRGGHGAIPDETVDAVLVAAQCIVAAQTVVSRNISPLAPAVVTFAEMHAGEAPNIIADTARLTGTLRAFDPEVAAVLPERLEKVIAGVCAAMGAEYIFNFRQDTPPTVNDPDMAALVRDVAREIVGDEFVRGDDAVRTMGAEDFGEILQRVPGCYFFVGAHNEDVGAVHPHHSPHFEICEDAMPVAVEVLEAAAREFLDGIDE